MVFGWFFFFLQDINECTTNATICGNNADCENTIVSYTCSCHQGYDIDENDQCVGKFDSMFRVGHHGYMIMI